MQEDPTEPRQKPSGSKVPALQQRETLADDCHVALVEVSERMFWLFTVELPRDQASDIAPFLYSGLRHTRHLSSIAHDRRRIADDQHIGNILNIHEWTNRHPARTICLGTEQFQDW